MDRRVHPVLKEKGDFLDYLAKTETPVKTAGLEYKVLRVPPVPEVYPGCQGCQAPKVTEVILDWTEPKESKAFKEKRGLWDHPEKSDHRDLLDRRDPGANEEETDHPDHPEYAASMGFLVLPALQEP